MATPLHNVSNSETVPSPSHTPADPTKEMNGVLEKLKESSVPSELTSFLELFQKGVNECLDFFKNKVTDPNSGLETKVTDLRTDVNALSSRVMVLENRESSHTVSTSASSKVPNSKIKEIENQLSEAEFNTQMLIHWADNMYKNSQSLQKQVNFHLAQHHTNKIIIGGVPELHNKSCLESTKQFLLDTLSVQVNDGDIYSAKRIGKQGKNIEIQSTNEEDELVIQHVLCPRHVVIKCAPHFKVTLMASRKQSAGQRVQVLFSQLYARCL